MTDACQYCETSSTTEDLCSECFCCSNCCDGTHCDKCGQPTKVCEATICAGQRYPRYFRHRNGFAAKADGRQPLLIRVDSELTGSVIYVGGSEDEISAVHENLEQFCVDGCNDAMKTFAELSVEEAERLLG